MAGFQSFYFILIERRAYVITGSAFKLPSTTKTKDRKFVCQCDVVRWGAWEWGGGGVGVACIKPRW